jgi:hypothetical protein
MKWALGISALVIMLVVPDRSWTFWAGYLCGVLWISAVQKWREDKGSESGDQERG